MNTLGLIFMILAGLALSVINVRKKRIFATLLSPKMNEDIDIIDKCLALVALLFFVLGILFLIIFGSL